MDCYIKIPLFIFVTMRSPYGMPVSLAVLHIWRRTLTWSSPVHIRSKETVAPGQCFAMSNHARDTCSSRLKSSREESVTLNSLCLNKKYNNQQSGDFSVQSFTILVSWLRLNQSNASTSFTWSSMCNAGSKSFHSISERGSISLLALGGKLLG